MDSKNKCDTCGEYYSPACNWQQGRCPHHPPYINPHSFRFLNLINSIKNFFKKGDCDCGHKH